MIQFNLLPDVKLQYLKAARTRRLIMSISTLASAVALVLLALLLLDVKVAQEHHLKTLNDNITSNSKKIQKISQLNKILTVQNQLDSLAGLHASKPAATRLFDYLTETTPVNADINNMTTDYTQKTVSITGTADALSTVNQYVDTLKFTTYKAVDSQGNKTKGNAFSNVVLSAFGRTDTKTTYTITLNYNDPMFDITQTVSLVVPSLVTTRSELDKPNALFTPAPVTSTDKTAPKQ